MSYKSKFTGPEIDGLLDKVKNIETEGGSDVTIQEITWADLVALRNDEELTAGQKYRIVDYETLSNLGSTAGHFFDIIVTALDNKTLDEKASAIWSARDTKGYFGDCNLPAWDVRYCLDNNTKHISALSKGCKIVLSLPPELGTTEEFVYSGEVEIDSSTQYKWTGNLIGYEAYIVTPVKFPEPGSSFLTFVPSISNDPVELDSSVVISEVLESTKEGKGVIYRLTDEHGNECCFDFKNIMFSVTLNSDGKYDPEGSSVECYTYSSFVDGEIIDASLSGNANHNIQGTNSYNNVFVGNACYDNVFENNCAFNIFTNSSIGNHFGRGVSNNIFYNSCLTTHFKGNSGNNIFKDEVVGSTFDMDTYENIFEDLVSNSVFGCYFTRNHFMHQCNSNIFGSNVEDNNFTNVVTNCSFGTSIINNTFETIQYSQIGHDIHWCEFTGKHWGSVFGNCLKYVNVFLLESKTLTLIIDSHVEFVKWTITSGSGTNTNIRHTYRIHRSASGSQLSGNHDPVWSDLDTLNWQYDSASGTFCAARNRNGLCIYNLDDLERRISSIELLNN